MGFMNIQTDLMIFANTCPGQQYVIILQMYTYLYVCIDY